MAMDKDTTTGVRGTADLAKGTLDDLTRAGETTTRRAADAARSIGGSAAETEFTLPMPVWVPDRRRWMPVPT